MHLRNVLSSGGAGSVAGILRWTVGAMLLTLNMNVPLSITTRN